MVIDMASPVWWGVCVLHLLVLPLAWRFLHRRFITKLTAAQAAAVAIASTWHVFFGSLGNGWPMGLDQKLGWFLGEIDPSVRMPLDFVRLWTLLAIFAAGYFHVYLRRRLRQRIGHQHFLQQNARRRSREIERVNHALRDEVARRQATQHRLDQSETTFQSIMDRMHLQVARKNAEGVFTYANAPFCKEIGREAIDVIGSTDADLYKPAVAARYRADDLKVMTIGQNIDKVEEHPSIDGQPGFVQVFKAPEYDQHGRCIGVQVIFWDITEKHRNEIALRHSEARKRALFDAAGDAVLLIDESGIIMEANPSATELLHAGGGRLVGRPLEHLIMPIYDNAVDHPNAPGEQPPSDESTSPVSRNGHSLVDRSRIGQPLMNPSESGRRAFSAWSDLPLSERHQLRLRRGDGVAFDSEVSMHVIPLGSSWASGLNSSTPTNSSGQELSNSRKGREREGLAVIIRDVTLQQQAFEAMRDAKAAAEQANRTKTQFMAGISHELRTPLGGIRGLTELLAQQTLPAPARRYVNLITQNTELLHDAIEDILDFSAIEAGRVAIAPTKIDLHSIVGDAFGCLAIRVANKPVRLSLSIAPDVPRFVRADAKRIRQVIVNLVGNAIKFTPSGQVSLRMSSSDQASPRQDEVETQHFQLTIQDTGIGIAPENQGRIFDAFEQADRGTNKQFGGTGLGLAIARGLAQRMGGNITLDSALGEGSRFVVDLQLPLAKGDDPNHEIIKKLSESQSSGLVVLSVDNPTIEEALTETIVEVGFKALRPSEISSRQSKSPLHWVLTGSAADAAFRVRARKSNDRVLWLTRAGEPAPRRAKKEDAIVIEPVHPDELRRWLAGVPLRQSSRGLPVVSQASLARIGTQVSASSTSGQASLVIAHKPSLTEPNSIQGHSVLVVDDSPTNRLVIHDQLAAAGHSVQTADGGEAALRCYQQHLSGDLRLDCILMDLQMPQMDGTEVTTEIIRLSHLANQTAPPVIALTAHVTDQHRQMCRDAGMVGYVTKPIHLEPLLEEMQRVITKQGAEQVDTPQPSPADDAWYTRLGKLCGNDESTIRSVCEAITLEIPDLVRRLERSGRAGNQKDFLTAVHTLKSCLRYVAHPDEIRLASELEKASNDSAWIDALRSGFQSNEMMPEVASVKQLKEIATGWVDRIQQQMESESG